MPSAPGERHKIAWLRGKQVQNAFAESFIGRLRDELLNEIHIRALCSKPGAWITPLPGVTIGGPLRVDAPTARFRGPAPSPPKQIMSNAKSWRQRHGC
jgi:hypothetical protein